MCIRGRHMFIDSRVRPFNSSIRPVGSHEYVHMRTHTDAVEAGLLIFGIGLRALAIISNLIQHIF